MSDKKWYHKILRRKKTGDKTPAEDETQKKESSENQKKTKLTRKEKRAAKKARPLHRRMITQTLKTLLVRIPMLVVIIIGATLVFLKLYLSPLTVEELAKTTFKGMSTGSLDLKVEKFTPYGGFVIKDLVIRSGEDFNNSKLLEIEKLVFDYGFFKIFTGSVRFPEIAIYKPRVYLKEKGGVWNAAVLMKPSEKKEEPEPEVEEVKESSPPSEINLPVAVDFLFNFVLQDLRVYVKGADFTSSLTGLSFNANIDIPPFKTIPAGIEAVKLLKTMKIELNPENSMEVSFNSQGASTNPDLTLMWKLIFQNSKTKQFSSSLKIGSSRMPLRLKNKYFSPLQFMVSYDVLYNPIKDYLQIKDLSVRFKKSNWLKLSGSVAGVTKSPVIDIRMDESDIPLKDLYPYYVLLTGDRNTYFGGNISLFPLTVNGTLNSQNIKGRVALKRVRFKVPGTEASVPSMNLDYFLKKNGEAMQIGADIKMPGFSYVLQGSKSGRNGLKLSARVKSPDGFKNIDLTGIDLSLFNSATGRSALTMAVNGKVNMGKNIKGAVNISKFRFRKEPLITMVPGRMKKQIEGIPLNKPVDLSLSSKFNLGSKITDASIRLGVAVPDYKLNDLLLTASIRQDNGAKTIRLKDLSLGSREMHLALKAKGTVEMKKSPLSNSDLKLSLELNNPKLRSVFGPWMSSGLIRLSAAMKGDLETGKASGSLVFKDFNIRNDKEKLSVAGLNMDFPFDYAFKTAGSTRSYIGVTQNQVIDSGHFQDKENFSIKSVRAKHPARDIAYEYMKDFSTNISFKNNVFKITDLKASVMDGSIYGRSILFNLADYKPENMEFNLILDATNIDVARLDDPDPKNKTHEAELSLNANFSGRGLNIQKELTASGYVSIYKIGRDFANKLMKGLSEEKGKSKLGTPVQFAVENAMGIEGFKFKLDKGLVYTTVNFTRKTLSLLVTVENSQVDFARIPIQEYLRKVTEVK